MNKILNYLEDDNWYKIFDVENEEDIEYKLLEREEVQTLLKEIERLKELLVKIYGLTFDIDSNIMKRKYALANGANFKIKELTKKFYSEGSDKE